jgi:hypothetical protein
MCIGNCTFEIARRTWNTGVRTVHQLNDFSQNDFNFPSTIEPPLRTAMDIVPSERQSQRISANEFQYIERKSDSFRRE